jgi:hypothetical protein
MRRQILIQFSSITFHVHSADCEILHVEGYSRADFLNILLQSYQRVADTCNVLLACVGIMLMGGGVEVLYIQIRVYRY